MSHMIIGEVSEFLRHTLWLGLTQDTTTSQLVTAKDNIVLSNPAQPLGANVVRQMSLWLYQVTANEHLRNAPPVRKREAGDDTAEAYPPLAINLQYLLTPSTGSDVGDQQVLGRALQIFHDQGVLTMPSLHAPQQAEELHVSLASRTIEELAKVWEAMQQPYRLSVCYEVRAARIESQRVQQTGRIGDRESRFGDMAA
ncbi:DUF4286 domain containing protein [Lysobacter dokdonensis DS-58]|uniref:DUF4286 domain containing protein n=1 Tax=Lysobacter dokdonensis DS-58 TaxID=1300345 RepID=A0A0A2X2B1_9GAMM|nr:DUF4255 domain-containing protein [Lysobacter dokdonensis]KGQ19384.1 DUF4286 domain containing protein [Lysobacter dokdonensis DS-58]